MAANVTVSGMPREMGGLKESIVAFRKHHTEVGAALLNISAIGTEDGLQHDKDDARPEYQHQEFPKMVYHAEKGELTVYDEEELTEAIRQKYRKEPYAKAQVALADPKAEKVALQAELKQKDGQIASLNDVLQKALARIDALEQKSEEVPEIKSGKK